MVQLKGVGVWDPYKRRDIELKDIHTKDLLNELHRRGVILKGDTTRDGAAQQRQQPGEP